MKWNENNWNAKHMKYAKQFVTIDLANCAEYVRCIRWNARMGSLRFWPSQLLHAHNRLRSECDRAYGKFQSIRLSQWSMYIHLHTIYYVLAALTIRNEAEVAFMHLILPFDLMFWRWQLMLLMLLLLLLDYCWRHNRCWILVADLMLGHLIGNCKNWR